MKKKVFFIVGLAVSAVAASFFIPMQDGSSWWTASLDAPIVTVIDVDRFPAGGPTQGEPFPAEGPEELPPVPEYEEEPVFTGTDKGGKDAPPEPYYPAEPAPAPAPYVPPQMNCIQQAFTEPGKKANGNYSRSWIRGVNMSPEYIDMFRNSAQKQFGKGKNSLRAAITGLVAAGYCPQKQSYRSAFPLRSTDVIPMVHGKAATANLQQRMQAWKANPNTRSYRCSRDGFEPIRKDVCEKIYQNCGLRFYSNTDCRMAEPSGKDDDDSRGGGNNSGGSSTGGREVGDGNNKDSGHEGNRDGGHGEGPPGSSR